MVTDGHELVEGDDDFGPRSQPPSNRYQFEADCGVMMKMDYIRFDFSHQATEGVDDDG